MSCVVLSRGEQYKSNWGCGSWFGHHEILVIITDQWNRKIFPTSTLSQFYTVRGYDSKSNVLVLSDYTNQMDGTVGLELRIWYSEDLMGVSESDNIGVSCADVYVMFN